MFRQTKSAVKYIRGNLSLKLWKYTEKEYYLNEENWTKHALHKLLDFEKDILNKMKIDGWDGVENPEKQQWTQMGALFYSIIVITTIGNLTFLLCLFFYFNLCLFYWFNHRGILYNHLKYPLLNDFENITLTNFMHGLE